MKISKHSHFRPGKGPLGGGFFGAVRGRRRGKHQKLYSGTERRTSGRDRKICDTAVSMWTTKLSASFWVMHGNKTRKGTKYLRHHKVSEMWKFIGILPARARVLSRLKLINYLNRAAEAALAKLPLAFSIWSGISRKCLSCCSGLYFMGSDICIEVVFVGNDINTEKLKQQIMHCGFNVQNTFGRLYPGLVTMMLLFGANERMLDAVLSVPYMPRHP